MTTEQIHSIFTVTREHLEEERKNSNELPRAIFQKNDKRKDATKMAASSNHSIFTVSRDHLAEGKNAPKKNVQLKRLF